MKSKNELEDSRDQRPENVLQVNGLHATGASVRSMSHITTVGVGKTEPTIDDVRGAIEGTSRPIDSLILSGHGNERDRHVHSGNQPRDGKETHEIDLLKGDYSTISNMEKIYEAADQKPKNILLSSCYGGAVGNDVAKNSDKFKEGTNILARGSSKHSTWGGADTVKRYQESSAQGSVNLADFAAKEAVRNPETINIHKIFKGSDGKNHTLSAKLIAPKTADGIAKLDNPESAKEFFER